MKKNWTKPTVLSLDKNNVNSGGTGTAYVEYISVCSGPAISVIDQYVNYPGNTSLISAGGTGATQDVIDGLCS